MVGAISRAGIPDASSLRAASIRRGVITVFRPPTLPPRRAMIRAAVVRSRMRSRSIVRITGGNFRLLHRLFVQIERILRINGLNAITEDVVEAARSTLVIGVT
ncbi:hypothetical protein [Sphingomonas desiccabilis]|uniref:hypothetical protein n=1 Tax=Sphingomonas desiccabilis TaxID=429134 RepID=UPI0018281B56|nr:hypothetical protein [Sphingomonas desiccabilis]